MPIPNSEPSFRLLAFLQRSVTSAYNRRHRSMRCAGGLCGGAVDCSVCGDQFSDIVEWVYSADNDRRHTPYILGL
jgi:hypothetical protein